jgi:hypothetical protein
MAQPGPAAQPAQGAGVAMRARALGGAVAASPAGEGGGNLRRVVDTPGKVGFPGAHR